MILAFLILIPICGGVLAWTMESRHPGTARWIALAVLLGNLGLTALLVPARFDVVSAVGPFLISLELAWMPALGIHFHLALDGLNLVLVFLTHFLGLTALAAAWTEIEHKIGFFYFNLLWVLAGIMGVFLALDLFLFYFFWEMMLIPMFFLISVFGHANRTYASIKFFLFTQISGLLMLLAILGLYFIHGRLTGRYTFNYLELLGTPLSDVSGMLLMLGFLMAFAVKLPAVPLHTWLPDAHTEAPTAGSIILAGLLLKTGAYGIMRFVVPLFPKAAAAAAPFAMFLAVIAILYGALLALSQTDFKRLVAYTSVSHMGFVMLAIFAWNQLALQGALIQIICHGLSTGALFFLAGALQERLHTRELGRMGGLWAAAPRLSGMALFFALASLGLPGLGNFIAEFTILLGVYQVSKPLAVLSALGLISAAVYSLWIIQAAFHGPPQPKLVLADLSGRESAALLAMLAALVFLGLYPQPVFTAAEPALTHLTRTAATQKITEAVPAPPGENPHASP